MSHEKDIARLIVQERRLCFASFNEEDAWALGSQMRGAAIQQKLPLVIDIRLAGRPLFYTALAGTTGDNPEWVRRKINVVLRYHKCSYRVGRELAKAGRALDADMGITPLDYAPHGGGFPIHVINTGIVGTVTVSGIPQRDDHNFVAQCLAAYLDVPYDEIALDADKPSS